MYFSKNTTHNSWPNTGINKKNMYEKKIASKTDKRAFTRTHTIDIIIHFEENKTLLTRKI